jgi:LmbE family N-acetylglucosaminyl deacetylase
MWLMAAPNSDRAVDITDTFDLKIAALRRHRSQVGEGEWLDARIRTWVEGAAVAAGLGEGHAAELFRVVLNP